jgi:hypothetical protein
MAGAVAPGRGPCWGGLGTNRTGRPPPPPPAARRPAGKPPKPPPCSQEQPCLSGWACLLFFGDEDVARFFTPPSALAVPASPPFLGMAALPLWRAAVGIWSSGGCSGARRRAIEGRGVARGCEKRKNSQAPRPRLAPRPAARRSQPTMRAACRHQGTTAAQRRAAQRPFAACTAAQQGPRPISQRAACVGSQGRAAAVTRRVGPAAAPRSRSGVVAVAQATAAGQALTPTQRVADGSVSVVRAAGRRRGQADGRVHGLNAGGAWLGAGSHPQYHPRETLLPLLLHAASPLLEFPPITP